jgi:hypothetical protein
MRRHWRLNNVFGATLNKQRRFCTTRCPSPDQHLVSDRACLSGLLALCDQPNWLDNDWGDALAHGTHYNIRMIERKLLLSQVCR